MTVLCTASAVECLVYCSRLTQLDWRDASEAGRLEAVVLVLHCREDTHSKEARRDADVDALLPEVRDLNHGHDFRALQDARRCELLTLPVRKVPSSVAICMRGAIGDVSCGTRTPSSPSSPICFTAMLLSASSVSSFPISELFCMHSEITCERKSASQPVTSVTEILTRSAKSCRAVISSGRTCSGGVRLVTSAGTDLQPRKRSTLGVTEIANGPVPTFNVKDGQLAG